MTHPPTRHPKHPNLVSISNASESRSERRRLPRINLSAEQFRLSVNGKIFSVNDLSTHGMSLRILEQQDFLLFPVATLLQGTLKLGDERHDVLARVRHLGAESVGCEFEGLAADASEALRRFLDPARLGGDLKPIPASVPAAEGGLLWYHGPSGTDLLLLRGGDGQYHRVTLYVLGSFVQWSTEGGITTGRARTSGEQSEVRGALRFETLLLDADAQADPGKLEVAKTLILSSNLAEDFKNWCAQTMGGA